MQRIWREQDTKDRYFILSKNKKVNHNKSIDGVDVSGSFWALFKDKSSTTREKNSRKRCKTTFNLQQDDKEEEKEEQLEKFTPF